MKESKMSSNENTEMSEFHYKIPKDPGRKTAILLAVIMHALLLLFLWMGIRWHSKEPVGVEAEIWDVKTRDSAPKSTVTNVDPPPLMKQAVKEKVKEEIKEENKLDPEIAIEQAREKKIQEQKRLEEQEQKKRQQELLKEQKRAQELKNLEQKKQEQAKITEQKKVDALIEQQRADNLKRLAGQTTGAGDAVKSTGNNRVDPDYAGKIAAKIKSNMVYVGSDNGLDNPTVEFRIDLFPDGSLRGAPRKTKSSGVPAFDAAVERAITKAAPYPADKSGKVPSAIPLTYRLKD